jgi:hypothetical protein
MTIEQIIALITTIIGAPILIEVAKKWFEGRNLKLQSEESKESQKDQREWQALETALSRERKIYQDILDFERKQFATRLADFETRLTQIRADAQACQQAYWEERLQRELLQTRVAHLEQELKQYHESTAR